MDGEIPKHGSLYRPRDGAGKLAATPISEDVRAAVIRQYCDEKISVGRIKKEHAIGAKTIDEILQRAGITKRSKAESQAISQKSRTGRRTQASAQNRRRRAGLEAGGLASAIQAGTPSDPDVILLRRDFAPVVRARVVDPKAPRDAWIVGRMVVTEERMRQMAEARRA